MRKSIETLIHLSEKYLDLCQDCWGDGWQEWGDRMEIIPCDRCTPDRIALALAVADVLKVPDIG